MKTLLIDLIVGVGIRICKLGLKLAGKGHVDVEIYSRPKFYLPPKSHTIHLGAFLKWIAILAVCGAFCFFLREISLAIYYSSGKIVEELRWEYINEQER